MSAILNVLSGTKNDIRDKKLYPGQKNYIRDKKLYPGQKTISGTKNDIRDKKRYPGQKTISGTKKRYQGDISFLFPPIINLIKAHVCDKNFTQQRENVKSCSATTQIWLKMLSNII